MIQAVIFDYDGVITDTEKFRAEVLNELVTPLGLQVDKNDKRLIGRKTHHFLQEVFPKMSKEDALKIREAWRARRLDEPTPLVPGAKEIISFLKNKVTLAITTGSSLDAVMQTITHFGLEGFSVFVTGDDFSTSKPNPECYLMTLEKLGLKGSEVIVIEDSVAGVQAAKQAGCMVIGLGTYHSVGELSEADMYCTNHDDVLKKMKKLLY